MIIGTDISELVITDTSSGRGNVLYSTAKSGARYSFGRAEKPEGELEGQAMRDRLSRVSEASLRITETVDMETVPQGVVDGARYLRGASRGLKRPPGTRFAKERHRASLRRVNFLLSRQHGSLHQLGVLHLHSPFPSLVPSSHTAASSSLRMAAMAMSVSRQIGHLAETKMASIPRSSRCSASHLHRCRTHGGHAPSWCAREAGSQALPAE